jgi:hypothetical protein
MGPEVKLTKQGVRDLNHLGPKKPKAVVEQAQPAAELGADKSLAPAAATEPAASPPIER